MNVLKRYALKTRILWFFMIFAFGLGLSGLYLILVKTPQSRADEHARLAVFYQKTLQQTPLSEKAKRRRVEAALKTNTLAQIAQYPFSTGAWAGFPDAKPAQDVRGMLDPSLKADAP